MNFFSRISAPTIVKGMTCAVLGLFLLFPLANDFYPRFEEPAPKGMAPAKAPPKFSKKALYTRVWQKRWEERAKKESGLWFPLVRVGNELFYTFFNQISAFYNGSVLMGKEGYLFQTAHLRGYNHRTKIKIKDTTARFQNLKKLQEKLRARGTEVIFLITPNLISLYPELVPGIYVDPKKDTRPDAYKTVVKILDQLGVTYVDSFDLLKKRSKDYPFRFFARSASHWNDVGSCLALQAINHKLKTLAHASFRSFSCDTWRLEDKPLRKDRDLSDIANMLLPSRFYDPTPYVDIKFSEPEPKKKPKVLLVGTSYLFALSEHLSEWGLTDDQLLYFYFRQWSKTGPRNFHGLKKERIDWNELFSREVIIINVGVGTPHAPGYGFVEAALKQLP